MPITQKIMTNMNRPAPRWLRIADGIIGDLEDVVLAVLMIKGYGADSPDLLIYKIISSFVRRQLKRMVANGEVYADVSQVKPSELQPVVEVKPVDK